MVQPGIDRAGHAANYFVETFVVSGDFHAMIPMVKKKKKKKKTPTCSHVIHCLLQQGLIGLPSFNVSEFIQL